MKIEFENPRTKNTKTKVRTVNARNEADEPDLLNKPEKNLQFHHSGWSNKNGIKSAFSRIVIGPQQKRSTIVSAKLCLDADFGLDSQRSEGASTNNSSRGKTPQYRNRPMQKDEAKFFFSIDIPAGDKLSKIGDMTEEFPESVTNDVVQSRVLFPSRDSHSSNHNNPYSVPLRDYYENHKTGGSESIEEDPKSRVSTRSDRLYSKKAYQNRGALLVQEEYFIQTPISKNSDSSHFAGGFETTSYQGQTVSEICSKQKLAFRNVTLNTLKTMLDPSLGDDQVICKIFLRL